MQSFAEALNAYTRDHPFDVGNGDGETVLDQLYQAYAESHESDPPEISEGFKELACFLETFLDLAKSCLDFREAVFDHIFDHNLVWSTWRQWRRKFQRAAFPE